MGNTQAATSHQSEVLQSYLALHTTPAVDAARQVGLKTFADVYIVH